MLYHPSISNFPVVDAFYFLKSARGKVTLIGIQTTTAKRHETTASKVCKFIEYLKNCFSDWTLISKKVSWEIIYLQPYDTDERRQIKEWQGCTFKNSQQYTATLQNAIIKFWKEKVNQYQVNMSQSMIIWLIEALEAMDTERKKKQMKAEKGKRRA
ncbi:putative retrotransposon hot spot (RHS) protein, partial [Trypanosoma theileri]